MLVDKQRTAVVQHFAGNLRIESRGKTETHFRSQPLRMGCEKLELAV
jgi:hypothetical protein